MKKKFINFKDARIHYRVTGNGFPVVLVHGFAEDGTVWDNQVEYLKENFRLIVPDLPGSGQSGMITGEGIGLENYANCIKAILENEAIVNCTMIGHSMGGYTCLAFAEKYSPLLKAFGLFHSSAYADDEQKVETRKKAIEFIRANGTEAFLKTSIPPLFFNQGNAEPINALIEKGKALRPAALIQYYEAMIARPDRTGILQATSLPVLFVMGEHDKAVPFRHSLEQSHIPRQSYVHILRNSAHMGMWEEVQKSNQILANFLQTADPKI